MENTQVLLNIVWTMVGAFLVYFMQAGFAMVETGFTRAKNSGNILMKNMMDFVLGSIFFFIIGFALMFGGSNAFIGTAGFFHPKSLADADGMFNGLPIGVFMIFQTVFCATSATIVSGAMAERTKFISYLIYSAAISIFIYPITGHWIWGGGWLSQIGFHDLQDLLQFIWSAVCVPLPVQKWSDLVSENTQKRENRLLFPVITFRLEHLVSLSSGSAGSDLTVDLPQQQPIILATLP